MKLTELVDESEWVVLPSVKDRPSADAKALIDEARRVQRRRHKRTALTIGFVVAILAVAYVGGVVMFLNHPSRQTVGAPEPLPQVMRSARCSPGQPKPELPLVNNYHLVLPAAEVWCELPHPTQLPPTVSMDSRSLMSVNGVSTIYSMDYGNQTVLLDEFLGQSSAAPQSWPNPPFGIHAVRVPIGHGIVATAFRAQLFGNDTRGNWLQWSTAKSVDIPTLVGAAAVNRIDIQIKSAVLSSRQLTAIAKSFKSS
jgi:hypothetical protein